MSLHSTLRFLALSAAFAALPITSATADLTIGSKAPKIDVEHWISNNEGKLPKVQTFEPNKVYVVEFWATWCGPCVASMPHLAEIQKTYADKGVQVISVSTEEIEVVEKFLERKVPKGKSAEGAKEMTFRELTAGYCLTTDPDGSVNADYMEAANQNGIPCAFLVGKDGIIEWIGHPMEMDEPLEQVVAGKWNREKFKLEMAEMNMIQESMQEVGGLLQSNQNDKALKMLDGIIEKVTNPKLKTSLNGFKIQILMEINPEAAAKLLTEVASKTEDVAMLNMMSWQVVEMSMSDNTEVPKILLEAATAVAGKAAKLAPKDGMILDTLSHLVHIKGDLDKAIELQKKAVELSPEVAELKNFLKQLETEKSEKQAK